VRNDPQVLEAIERTLTNDYKNKGFYHGDVRWRNIGIRRKGGEVSAVVFDMESVEEIALSKQELKEDWVERVMAVLKDRL
jgi:hypothetical protein